MQTRWNVADLLCWYGRLLWRELNITWPVRYLYSTNKLLSFVL